MDDLLKAALGFGILALVGVAAYGLLVVISVIKRRALGRMGLAAEELESLHVRMAAVDLLEARVDELEGRLDFAERLIAQHQQETERIADRSALDH